MPEIGLLSFVPERWGGIWMPRHQVSTRLARYFRVIWMNPAVEWRQTLFRPRSAGNGSGADHETAGFRIREPEFWLPRIYRPDFLARWTNASRIRRASRALRVQGCEKIVFYIWRPNFADALDLADPDLSVYHIDDEYSFSEVEVPISSEEAGLIRRADQVFIHSPALMEKKGRINPNTSYVPNGVDFKAYSEPAEEPEDLGRIPRPRIGYIGVIKMQLDFESMIELADRKPEWSLVLVGPLGWLGESRPLLEELLKRPNVHWLGGKPLEALPAYTQHLDVCLMPYRVNDYTRYIFPLKLHEYLAAGRPVVGSPIRSLLDYGDSIHLAGTIDEWERAIERALSPEALSSEQVGQRLRIARQHDWNILVRTIAGKICERLDGPCLERFRNLPESSLANLSPCFH